MPVVKTQGIVLKQVNMGEADRIITLFTDNLGKVQAVAHGARKAKSKLMSSTQIFSYCEYVLYKGKNLYTISQSEIKESFQVLLGDLYTLTYSSYLVELINVMTQYDETNIELFRLILKVLYLMSGSEIDKELLVRAFELKSMSISGYMPDLNRCSICSRDDPDILGFSIRHGGIVCGRCVNGAEDVLRMDASTLNTLRYLMRNDMERIRSLRVNNNVKESMKKIMKNYIKYYLEREFKSLDFLDEIRNIDKC
jgi:DNA repair protein RecO (recombination protein O)